MGSTHTKKNADFEHEIALYLGAPESKHPTARQFINSCPTSVKAKLRAVLIAVASAPPKRFSGGGYWEAMHGKMAGWHEIRVAGPGRIHYRLFCLLDYEALNSDLPLLAVIYGMSKPNGTKFTDDDYARVRRAGERYLSQNPRQIE